MVEVSPYGREFYERDVDVARTSVAAVVPFVVERVAPRSVIDLGCGRGTWLAEFARHGVVDYVGVDGEWMSRDVLAFPEERFVAARLDKPFRLDRQFDLAISLEVAEHLHESAAKQFVETIVRLAPCVLFSAAVPHQGGTQHVNEQWPDYWAALFAGHGYEVVDGIRPLIWSNPDVAFFHAQNILIFARPEVIAARPLLARDRERTIESQLCLVHPRLLSRVVKDTGRHIRLPTARDFSLRETVEALPHAVARSFRWRWRQLTHP
jgi:SAM-dependent methyltransferase